MNRKCIWRVSLMARKVEYPLRILIDHRNNNLRCSSFQQLQDGLGRINYLKRPKLEKNEVRYSPFIFKTVFTRSLFDTKKWYFHQTCQPYHSWHQLNGLAKLPLFCVKQRSCKHCFKKEWTLVNNKRFYLKTDDFVVKLNLNRMINNE